MDATSFVLEQAVLLDSKADKYLASGQVEKANAINRVIDVLEGVYYDLRAKEHYMREAK